MKTTKQLVKFDFDVAVITTLDAKYKDIQITDGKSYALVMAGLAEYRDLRLKIDDIHKKLKKDILKAGRGLDGDKNRLKALLEPGENHLKEIRQTEDDRKAKIKAEKDRKEIEQIAVISEKINVIRSQGILIHGAPSHIIEERLTIIKAMKVSPEIFMEYTGQAVEAQNRAISELEKALTQRLQFEKEEVDRTVEARRLEIQREEQEAAQAKIDEENRKIELAKHEIDEKKAEEERRLERAEFERQATIKAEQEAKEKGAREEQEKIEKEEAEAQEKARQESLRPDREKLIKFADGLYDIPVPDVKSAEAQQILSDASDVLDELSMNMKVQAKEL